MLSSSSQEGREEEVVQLGPISTPIFIYWILGIIWGGLPPWDYR